MRKLILFAFIISAFAVSASTTQAQVLREILDRMDGNNKTLQSLVADVTMVKTDQVLGESDTTYGDTSYLPKSPQTKNQRYVRINWTRPVQEQIAVIGDKYELYRPRLNQVIQGTTGKAQNSSKAAGALAFMSMSKDELKANYTVTYIGEESVSGAVSTWHLQLTPKTKTSYKLAEIWVDKDGMPRQAKITENNNDTTTVLLSNIKKNDKISGDTFRLAYDKKKVKVIQG